MVAKIPAKYAWLANEPGPLMLRQSIALLGVTEYPGSRSNPIIMDWAEETGLDDIYTADSVPWCGLFMALVAQRAHWAPPPNPLWALNWLKWERPVPVPMLGDVLVFERDGGGHVAEYVAEDDTHFHILGANQSDAVNIVRRHKKDGFRGARRPNWRIAQPPNVRRVFVSANGTPIAGSEQ